MSFLSLLATLLLLAPPAVIAGFWWMSVHARHRRPGRFPDTEAVVLARVGGILCAILPTVQMFASIFRYRTGEPGLYLWFLVPLVGLLLALFALATLLTHARGYERAVSSGMVLLSVCTLLLLTLLGTPGMA